MIGALVAIVRKFVHVQKLECIFAWADNFFEALCHTCECSFFVCEEIIKIKSLFLTVFNK